MSELAATKTPIQAHQLDAALTHAWLDKLGSIPPTNAIELLMSQSALETGAWASCVAFNLGNAKSNGTSGDWCFFTTWEIVTPAQANAIEAASTAAAPAHKVSDTKVVLQPRHPGCRFRAFTDLATAARWYLDFLASHYAAAWPAVLAGDPFAFVHALKAHGYFTADEKAYISGVCRFFDEYGTPRLGDMTAINAALATLDFASTSDFQSANGLVVDNTPGPITRAKLRVALAAVPPPCAA